MSKKIYLSPSNQRSNTYATGNTNEMEQCDKIAAAASTALKRCGFEVMVGKSGTLMETRCVESNKFGADIHMPIHTNASGSGTVTGGTLVMLYKNDSDHNKAGKAILNAVAPITPGKDYSLSYRQDLYELSVPNAMSIYLEVEFHDTKEGSDWIIKNITNIGEAICKGICSYFGISYKSPTVNSSSTATAILDSKGFSLGDDQTGVLYLKELLRVARLLGVHDKPVSEDNDEFGKSVTVAVNACLKKWGYKESGIAGINFARKLFSECKSKIY